MSNLYKNNITIFCNIKSDDLLYYDNNKLEFDNRYYRFLFGDHKIEKIINIYYLSFNNIINNKIIFKNKNNELLELSFKNFILYFRQPLYKENINFIELKINLLESLLSKYKKILNINTELNITNTSNLISLNNNTSNIGKSFINLYNSNNIYNNNLFNSNSYINDNFNLNNNIEEKKNLRSLNIDDNLKNINNNKILESDIYIDNLKNINDNKILESDIYIDNSETDNSETDNSETDNSETDNSETDNSETDNSETDNSETDNSEIYETDEIENINDKQEGNVFNKYKYILINILCNIYNKISSIINY